MLDMEDNASEYIKESITWDLSIKLINADDELQW